MASAGTFDPFREATGYLDLSDYAVLPAVCSTWCLGVRDGDWAIQLFPRHKVLRKIHRATSARIVLRAMSWIDWKTVCYNSEYPEFGDPSPTILRSENFRRVFDTCVYFDVPGLLYYALSPLPDTMCIREDVNYCVAARLLQASYVKAHLLYMPVTPQTPWRAEWLRARNHRKRRRVPILMAVPTDVSRALSTLWELGKDMIFESYERKGMNREQALVANKALGYNIHARFEPREHRDWLGVHCNIYDKELTKLSDTFLDERRAEDAAADNERHRAFNTGGYGGGLWGSNR